MAGLGLATDFDQLEELNNGTPQTSQTLVQPPGLLPGSSSSLSLPFSHLMTRAGTDSHDGEGNRPNRPAEGPWG